MDTKKQKDLVYHTIDNTLEDLKGVMTIDQEYSKMGKSIDAQNSMGLTRLMIASIFGDLSKVKRMVEQKVDLNIVKSQGNSAIMLAAWNGRFDIVRFLDGAGADITIVNKKGQNITDLILDNHLETDGVVSECAKMKALRPIDAKESGHFPKKTIRRLVVKELNTNFGSDVVRDPPHC